MTEGFVKAICGIRNATGHDGLTLTALRSAQAEVRSRLKIDERRPIEEQRRRLMVTAIEQLLPVLQPLIDARDDARTEAELREVEAALQDGWTALVHRMNQVYDQVCPRPARKSGAPRFD